MTNRDWCLSVLKAFWGGGLIVDTTDVNPALSQIAGEIWNEWVRLRAFTGAIDVLAHNNPSTPPDGLWLLEVAFSWAWQEFSQTADF